MFNVFCTGLRGLQYTYPLLALVLAFGAATPVWGQSMPSSTSQLETQRSAYKQALKALRKNQIRRYKSLLPTLEGYPLKPHLEYRYLVARMRKSNDEAIQAYLVKYEDSHWSQRMRRAWLPALFKRRQYQRLIDAYRPQGDVSLDCLYVRAHIRLKRPTETLQRKLHSIWLHGKSRPKICDPLLKWFRTHGLNRELVWQRIQLSMERRNTRLARYLKRFLPKAERSWVDLWIRVHRNPSRYLKDPRLQTGKRHLQMIAVHGITRLANREPEAAQQWTNRLASADALDADWIQELHYRIATSAAYLKDPTAKALMESIPASRRDDNFQHLRLRLALHEQNWNDILQASQNLPGHYPYDRMRLYWEARALEQLGNRAASMQKYLKLAGLRGYYGFLAAERIGKPHSIRTQPPVLTAAQLMAADRIPAVARAREFYYHYDIRSARLEWDDLLAQETSEKITAAAVLAYRWGWHEGTIRGYGKSNFYDDLQARFPQLYSNIFSEYAQKHGFDPALSIAVTRRESAFVEDTRSSAGAIGLMQLMPSTARMVARELKLKRPRTKDLSNPQLNIRLGSRYLANMLRRYEGNLAMALAAYNAGPAAVDRWRPETDIDADLWIDSIPYQETRKYVRTVLEYMTVYRWLNRQTSKALWPQIHPVR